MAAQPHNLYRSALKFYLAFVALIVGCIGILNLHQRNDWAMGDWLINYSGGFVRRGFIGELALGLSRWHLSPFVCVLVLQLALYAAIFYAILRLTRGIEWNIWTLALVYSPATLSYPLNDPSFAYRKEILFLALLCVLLLLMKVWSDYALCAMLAVSAAICVLSHEALIVFFPYLFCALLLGYGSVRRAIKIAALPAVIALGCFALTLHFPGSLADSSAICSSLGYTLTAPTSGFCGGAIAYLSRNAAYAHAQVLAQASSMRFDGHFAMVAGLALLAPVVIVLLLWRRREERFAALALTLCALASMAASIPLFLYGIDWTRWIYIHAFSLCLLLLYVLRQPGTTLFASRPLRAASPALRYAAIAALALYVFGWNLSLYQPRIPFGGLVHYAVHHAWNYPNNVNSNSGS